MYLNERHLVELAGVGVGTYEFTAQWRDAARAMREHAFDEWGVRLTAGQAGLAMQLAQVEWERMVTGVKAALA